jgi:tetratricopeptide (TPR) repeat protein
VLKVKHLLAVILVISCWSCQHSQNNQGTTPGDGEGAAAAPVVVPDRVDESNAAAMFRRFMAAPAGAPGRDELRRLLIARQVSVFDGAFAHGDEAGALEAFAGGVGLYEADELEPGALDPALATMAQRLLDTYEPRGDEAMTLASLLVLSLASPDPARYTARYDEVVRWSEDVRSALPSDTERVLGLVDVFERVTRLVPVRDPVDRLAALYLERHRAWQGVFGGMVGLQALLSPEGRGELQALMPSRGESVSDIVSLYLRAGQPERVRQAVANLEPLEAMDRELVEAVRDLQSDRRRARGLAFLASRLGQENPDVALRLCHEGQRSYPEDSIFTQCLAEVYRFLGDREGALEYYESTLATDPAAENYERTLQYVAEQMEEQLTTEDAVSARETHARAERILQSYAEHFPGREAPIQSQQLAYLIGMGEFNAGNIDQAILRLQASIEQGPTRDALVQLGFIEERRGEAEQAVRHYRQALDLREGPGGENPLYRAIILAHLADAFALSGRADRAAAMYNEALVMLGEAENTTSPEMLPDVHIERGLVLYKLGRTAECLQELDLALSSAPQRRQTYGRLLSFYVGHGMLERALDLYRIAFNHSDLERTWKVYYSMWVIGLQRRSGAEPEGTAVRYLQSVDGDDWVGRLGRFYAGTLPYEQLLAAAQTPGQRAEAYYYEAVLQLAQGNRARGLELLQQVLGTNMMGYYEYDFARELQDELAAAPPPQQNASTAPATSR